MADGRYDLTVEHHAEDDRAEENHAENNRAEENRNEKDHTGKDHAEQNTLRWTGPEPRQSNPKQGKSRWA